MRRSFRGKKNQNTSSAKNLRANEKIFVSKVNVIDETGQNLGTLDTKEAIEIAASRGLDLVEVSPKVEPPICKIMDYGSFKYQKEKQERKAKAKQKSTELKTVKLSTRIGDHDLDLRVNRTVKFLSEGHKVRIELQLRGREHQHVDLAKDSIRKMIDRSREKLEDKELKTEQPVSKQGSKLSAIVTL
jgi:translation initiation factor IF-3